MIDDQFLSQVLEKIEQRLAKLESHNHSKVPERGPSNSIYIERMGTHCRMVKSWNYLEHNWRGGKVYLINFDELTISEVSMKNDA